MCVNQCSYRILLAQAAFCDQFGFDPDSVYYFRLCPGSH
jgi:hypothetical protein